MSTRHHAGARLEDDLLEQTVRSTLTAPSSSTAADRARRSALLRENERRSVAGVCAAVARALGAPVRLTRVTAFVLALLGIGVPTYLLAMLLVPRTTRPGMAPATAEAAEAAGTGDRARSGDDSVEVPLVAMATGKVRRADVAALLALLPAGLIGLWWIVAVLAQAAALTAVLLALAIILLGLLSLAARRAGQARRALVLALLARRADLADEQTLEVFLLEQHRRAPWAWDRLAHGDARAVLDPEAAQAGITHGEGRQSAKGGPGPSRRMSSASARTVSALLAGMLAACALVTLVLNLDPDLAPSVAGAPLLPQIGRVGAGLAAATALAGLALCVLGWRGRHSLVLALAGLLALSGAGLAGTWLRLTADPQAAPYVLSVDDLEDGMYASCPEGLSTWSRPITIDLRDLTAEDAERIREQRQRAGAPTDGTAGVIHCSRMVGSLTVLMPADPGLVEVGLNTLDEWVEAGAWDGDSILAVYGDVFIGPVEIVEHPRTKTEE